jgi:threonine/homoserine/homoserine lactone efflux protein
MPGFELLLAFAVATAAFAFYPGPALLYTAAQTLAGGRKAGLMAVLGIHLGGYVHVASATLGLSALLQAVPTLYLALKLGGAIYLVWLGIGMLRAAQKEAAPEVVAKSARRALIDSSLVEVLNPKAALFFLAFLPQFVDPAAAFPVWLQFLILGTLVNLSFAAADLVAVFAASTVASTLRGGSGIGRLLQRMGGGLMIGLGVKLATDRT